MFNHPVTAVFRPNGQIDYFNDTGNLAACKRALRDPLCCGIIRFRDAGGGKFIINYILFFTRDVVDKAKNDRSYAARRDVSPLLIYRSFIALAAAQNFKIVEGVSWLKTPMGVRGWNFWEVKLWGLIYPINLLIWLSSIVCYPLLLLYPLQGMIPFKRYRIIRGRC